MLFLSFDLYNDQYCQSTADTRPSSSSQALAALQVASAPSSPASTRQRLLATPQLLATLLGLACGHQQVPSLPSVHSSGAWTTQGSGWGSELGEVEQWTTLCLDDAPLSASRWVGALLVVACAADPVPYIYSHHREGGEDPRVPMALRAGEALRNLSGLLDKPRLVAMVCHVRADGALVVP